MKNLLALFCFCIGETLLLAQGNTPCDTIVLKSGRTIAAVIGKTTDSEIFYTPCSDKNAPQRAIGINFVRELRTEKGVKTFDALTGDFIIPDTARQWHVTTKDGNEYIGAIVSMDSDKVVVRTASLGEIGIPKSQIGNMAPIQKGQLVEGEFWYVSPHNTRYFWAPNGFGLQKGEGYYQNTWVLFNQVSYGITNNFSLGLGIIPTFLFGADGFPFWVTPKISVPIRKDQLNIGAGVLYANAVGLGFENEGGAGIAYGVLTTGSRDQNFTLGMGYGFAAGGWAKYPAITLSGMYRSSKKFTLLTENYIIPLGGEGAFGIISVGGRYGGKSIALDFGLFRPVSEDLGGFWALPWLGINVPFGTKH